MSRPLFEVGEEVIVCSKLFPEANGEATIIGIGTNHREMADLLNMSEDDFFANESIGYLTDPTPPPNRQGNPALWSESALRKKHKPGESFDTLMQQLKKPVTA